ncbi:MAG: ribosome biogenesis GTPase Der [Gammaproteobacteria bacterium]|nr:ribosome biogenesis GTPase Der [Gammaproteobacteria bacterium]MCY4322361.1 ribosome biogenesis GTPase Der [Gammaproteobacteria bacterium]
MHSSIVLVGRPNVGKSTLFNRLTRTRDALVADIEGVTRDRRYGRVTLGERAVSLIDTGGFGGEDVFGGFVDEQIKLAINESRLALLVLDAKSGPVAGDLALHDNLRRSGCAVLALANKCDGIDIDANLGTFAELGLTEAPLAISALHGTGIRKLLTRLEAQLDLETLPLPPQDGVRIAIIGRPNVGKSTLVNRLLGEERQLVSDVPGTTRDVQEVTVARGETRFHIVDTAGIRRKGKVSERVEKFSVVKSLEAMNRCEIVLLLLDACEGMTSQDLHLMQYALDAGCGLVLCLNKWDRVGRAQALVVAQQIERRLGFADFIPVRRISALRGDNIDATLALAKRISEARRIDHKPSEVTAILMRAVEAQPPPLVSGRRVKLRYAHKAADDMPRIVIHGSRTSVLPNHYARYLERVFRERLGLVGSSVQLSLKDAPNPFAGKRNQLSRRQLAKRRRVITHSKRS